MKRVLITGKNSYIGKALRNWLAKDPEKYEVDLISVRDDSWKKEDFSKYDTIYHVAGIAHIRETKENKNLYYRVNRDLAYEIAKKAKIEGIQHFIFLSSMSVYGVKSGVIYKDTPLNATNAYGKSKIEAEKLIENLADDKFTLAILRPPMVYGKNCKGNYSMLAKLAIRTPIFPDVNNKRSMIYIDNLSEFVTQLIEDQSSGFFFPQNEEYVNTSEMVRLIAEAHCKKIKMIKLFNPLLNVLHISTLNKVFGDLVYDKEILAEFDKRLNNQKVKYKTISFEESISLTER